jgi:type I restriction enzyme S subunit
MASNWPPCSLAEVSCDISYGYTESASEQEIGPHFLRITDIQGGTVNWSKVPYCKIDPANHKKYKLEDGDIVVARTGNSTGENYIFTGEIDAVYASYLIRFRIDDSKASPLYVWYNMRSHSWWDYISNSKTGSAQAGANANILSRYTFPLPPLLEQKAIASTLGALDDKIDCNRRMNETLEAMARAMFKDWFVDFGPTKAKMEGRAPYLAPEIWDLFPDRLDDEGKPEGWEMSSIESVAKKVACGPFGSSIKVATFVDEGVPVISGQHLHGIRLFDQDYNYITEEHADKLRNSNVFAGDLVFTHAGNIGQVVYVPETASYNRYAISQRQFYLRPDPDRISYQYLVLYFKSSVGQHKLLANASQVGVPSIARPVSYLKSIIFLVPPSDILEAFNQFIIPLFSRCESLVMESKTLAHTRDLLLPKLMSGEIRVKGAERAVEDVL